MTDTVDDKRRANELGRILFSINNDLTGRKPGANYNDLLLLREKIAAWIAVKQEKHAQAEVTV